MIETLIDQLIDLNINIELVDQEKLRIHSDINKIPDDILSEIRLRKDELVHYLAGRSHHADFGRIPTAPQQNDYALSSAQRRMWILQQLEEGHAAYNIPGLYRFGGSMDLAALQRSFNRLIERHEILRTVFRENEKGELRQSILPAAAVRSVIECRDLRETCGDEQQTAILWSEFTRPFDLASGPLVRAVLFHVAGDAWILAYTLHHIITDGWSMGILIKELSDCYQACTAGKEWLPAPLRIQYKDYACWQQDQLNGEAFRVHKAYWLHRLSGELPVLELPGDKPRPGIKTYKGGIAGAVMDANLLLTLRSLCQEQGTTLFMGLLAGVNALLYRYTDQNDIIIGTPIAGREHADLERQIGMYVNTLALRTRLSSDDSFQALLEIVRAGTLDAYDHQSYPFDRLVEDLDLPRDLSRTPLFDVMIIYNNDPASHAGSTSHDEASMQGGALSKFDLTFTFTESADTVYLSLEYSEDIFTRETAGRLVRHFGQLLLAACTDPKSPVGTLDFLAPFEKDLLLQTFNDTARPLAPGRTIIDLFADRAAASPDQRILVCGETYMNYKELDEWSDKLRNYLQQTWGIGRGGIVGIRLPRDPWLVISILGVLKCGAAYIPLDPAYPAERIDHILKDSGCTIVLDEDELAIARNGHGWSGPSEPVKTVADDLAYIIYTSGSTGGPKGVMITHGSVVNEFAGLSAHLLPGEDDCLLAVTSASFDISLNELLWPLCSGVQVVIHPGSVAIGGLDAYVRTDDRAGSAGQWHKPVTILQATPSFIRLLDEDPGSGKFLRSLAVFLIGGEPLPMSLFNKIRQYSRADIYNMYGPTETTIWSCMHKFGSGEEKIVIGRPMMNTRVYILDKKMQLTPLGVPGEICIGGHGLSKGYLKRPALTEEKFVPDPFHANGRIYRTGDMGRWLPDGILECLGRKDHQVKIRGYRIETAEVELVLDSYPDVESAVVTDWTSDQGDHDLVAYLVGRQALDLADLRSHLGKTLPSFMIPAYFVQLPGLPLTPNGKVDRKNLPAPFSGDKRMTDEYLAPRNKTERQLAKVWETELNKHRIGIRDDYFQLGGDSLKAMRIIKATADETGYLVPLKLLFSEKNIEGIAAYIAQQGGEKEDISMAPLHKSNAILSEASYNQHSFFSDWNKKNDNIVVSVYEYGILDDGVFSMAVSHLLERHEVLRTVFIRDDEKLLQKVLPADNCCRQISHIPAETSPADLSRIIENEYSRTFDLATGPLFFIQLHRKQDGGTLVIVTMHHIITDGYSGGIMKKELAGLYTNILLGHAQEQEPLPWQYKDYSRWQRTFVDSPHGIRHRDYWLNRLKDFDQKVHFTDKTGSGEGKRETIGLAGIIGDDWYAQTELFARSNGLTMTALLMGTLLILLHRSAGQRDITLLTSVSGRNSKYFGNLDVSGLIGYFSNFLLVRNQVDPDRTVLDFLHGVQDNFVDDLGHDAYPYDRLMNDLACAEQESFLDSAVFYNYHNYAYKKETEYIAGEEPAERRRGGEMPLAFGLSATEYRNCLVLQFVFDAGLFGRDRRSEMRDQFFSDLRAITAHPLAEIRSLFNHKII